MQKHSVCYLLFFSQFTFACACNATTLSEWTLMNMRFEFSVLVKMWIVGYGAVYSCRWL
jgi:hypothetical protein